MLTSGTTAKVAESADAVSVIANTDNAVLHHVRIINGGAAGSFSIDGTNYMYLPGPSSLNDAPVITDIDLSDTPVSAVVSIKRIGETNMGSVFAYAW